MDSKKTPQGEVTDVFAPAPDTFDGIPLMGKTGKGKDKETAPLGAVKAEVRSKSNLTMLFKVGMAVGAIIILAAALLIFQRMKPQRVQSVQASKVPEMPSFLKENADIKSDDVNAKKEEIIKADIAQAQRNKALGIQSDANSFGAPAQFDNAGVATPVCAGDKCPPTPEQRKLMGEATIELPAVQQGQGATSNYSGNNNANGGLPADYPKPPDLAEILKTVSSAQSPSNGMFGASGGTSSSPSLNSQLKPTVLEARYAGKLSDMDYLLKRGTIIPCSLKTGIDTTLSGIAICTATNDVYSANGKVLLISRGATIHGEQQSSVKLGQARVFLLWTRIDNPDGTTAELDSPAADAMGFGGIAGFVDTHFGERFGAAILISVIKDATSFALSNLARNNPNGVQNTPTNTLNAGGSMAQDAMKNSVNIPPTIVVNPATLVNVLVARDISFEKVYSVIR